MIRNIFIAIGGIILSLLLFALSGWFLFKFTVMGKIVSESVALGYMMDGKDVVAKFGDPFKSMEMGLRIIQYGIFPAGSILIGTYVGLLSRKCELLVSVITLFPFIILTGSTDPSRIKAFIFGVGYLILCSLATYVVLRRRIGPGKTAKDVSNNATTPDERVIG